MKESLALLGLAALAACSGPRAGVQSSPQPAARPQGDLAAVARARTDSTIRPYTEADIEFMSGMIGHHAQAIVMAGWAPSHGGSSSVQVLAERIINAQQDEILTMRDWLADRHQPVMQHDMLMPGMLSESQMQRLDQARGAEFDRLFLSFMIQHHKGAVSMVQQLFGSYGAGQDQTVFKFASDVNVDQSTEIARMERMLAALATSPQ
jgi:uncharacterized protein (DUF305 family)